MSSDYIPRLRQELLRAGAGQERRWRRTRLGRTLRPLAPVAVAALVAVALVVAWPAARDDAPVEPAGNVVTLAYDGAQAEQAAQILRERLAKAGVEAQVHVTSPTSLTITAPAAAQVDVEALAQPGRLAFYDWEASLRGPAEGTTRAEAEKRGGLVVRAEGAAERWVVLRGEPALTNADVARAGSGIDPRSQEPIVTLEFSPRGQDAFTALTRELAHRGSAHAEAEDLPDIEAAQHFAIVVDDRVVNLPFIGFWEVPDGIDGRKGAQITGGLEPDDARRLAAILDTGPLPAELIPSGAGGDEELPRG